MDYIVQQYNQYETLLYSLLSNGFFAILIVIGASFVSKIVKKGVYNATKRLSKGDEVVSRLLSKITSYAVYLVGFVIILDLFGFNTTSLVALMGAAGLAIGLALRDTLSNIAAGVMILFLKPIKIEEFVEFGSYSGTVKDIGLFTTEFQTGDGLYISTPNSMIWNSTIRNYSRNPTRRIDLTVNIGPNDSIDAAFGVLKNLANSHENLLKEPEPQVIVQTIVDGVINLQLRAWVPTDKYFTTLCDLQKHIKPKIEEAGLSIPFPQRELLITKKEE